MTTYYIAPTGSGKKNGLTRSDPVALADLNYIMAKGSPGDEFVLMNTGEPYKISKPINITHGGGLTSPTSIRPMCIRSEDRSSVIITGNRQTNYSPKGQQGPEVFRLLAGSDFLVIRDISVEGVNCVVRIADKVKGLDIRNINANNVNSVINNFATGNNTSANVTGLYVSNLNVTNFAEKIVSLRYGSSDIKLLNIKGDGNNIDGSDFSIGIHLQDEVNDVLIAGFEISNIKDTTNAYWNGDGIATELGVHDIQIINGKISHCTDAGLDLKSSNTRVGNVEIKNCTRNIRAWSNGIKVSGSKLIDPVYYGGSSKIPSQIWLNTNVTLELTDSELVDTTALKSKVTFDYHNANTHVKTSNVIITTTRNNITTSAAI